MIQISVDSILRLVKEILKWAFGEELPPNVYVWIGYFALAILILATLYIMLYLLVRIRGIVVEEVIPLFYKQDEKVKVLRRQRFAEHISNEIRRLNLLEEWQDYKYTELEAEVEVEGESKSRILFKGASSTRLRREQSLSKALQTSNERLILLQGEPGSGKSVAIRHSALELAESARRSKSLLSPLPVYVNLKEFKVSGQINADAVRTFLMGVLNRPNDRDIDDFLMSEFEIGLRNGSWIFLFDSFDEIPEILSSVESDDVTRKFADAISDFMSGMNNCRGIIASRQFRGPLSISWPKFRILRLSKKRKEKLVRNHHLQYKLEQKLLGELDLADPQIKLLSDNPMFLGLLVEYFKSNSVFPQNAFIAYMNFIDTRLSRDASRLRARYGVEVETLKQDAEKIAFSMISSESIGLDPTKKGLIGALNKQGLASSYSWENVFSSLEYIKLGREGYTSVISEPTFSFAHRRFQEYFATSYVIKNQNAISPLILVTNAMWRETAVALLQLQAPESIADLISILGELASSLHSQFSGRREVETPSTDVKRTAGFLWLPSMHHLFSIMQEGFKYRPSLLTNKVRELIGSILSTIFVEGSILDKKWVLEIVGCADSKTMTQVLQLSFNAKSEWLKDEAHNQISYMNEISPVISWGIRDWLVRKLVSGDLFRNRRAIKVYFSRSNQLRRYETILNMLVYVPIVDTILLGLFFIVCYQFRVIGPFGMVGVFLVALGLASSSWNILAPEISYFINKLRTSFTAVVAIPSFVLLVSSDLMLTDFAELGPIAIPILMFIYVAYWPGAAQIVVMKLPNSSRIQWWPFYPVWPIFLISRKNVTKLVMKLVGSWQKTLRELIIALLGLGLLVAIGGTATWLFRFLPEIFGRVIGLALFIALVVPTIYGFAKRLIQILSDMYKLRKFRTKSKTIIHNMDSMCQVFTSFANVSTCLGGIRFIRTNALMNPDEKTINDLSELLLSFEGTISKTQSPKKTSDRVKREDVVLTSSDKANAFLTKHLPGRISGFTFELVDEIGKLQESLILRRAD